MTPESRCKRDAEKKVLLTSAPAHLNITLLRFKYDRENNRRAKVFTGVEYPHTLLLPVGDEQVSYSLFSVVVHRCNLVLKIMSLILLLSSQWIQQ